MTKDEWPELDIKIETVDFDLPTEVDNVTQEYSFEVSDWMICENGSFEWEGEKVEASCRWVNSKTGESFPYRGGLKISRFVHRMMKIRGKE